MRLLSFSALKWMHHKEGHELEMVLELKSPYCRLFKCSTHHFPKYEIKNISRDTLLCPVKIMYKQTTKLGIGNVK